MRKIWDFNSSVSSYKVQDWLPCSQLPSFELMRSATLILKQSCATFCYTCRKREERVKKTNLQLKIKTPLIFFFLKPTRGHCPLDNFVSTRLRWRSHLKIKNWFWRKSFWFSLWMLTIIIWILKGINLVFKNIYVNNKCEYATWNQLSIIFLPFALSLTSMHQDIDMTIFFFSSFTSAIICCWSLGRRRWNRGEFLQPKNNDTTPRSRSDAINLLNWTSRIFICLEKVVKCE